MNWAVMLLASLASLTQEMISLRSMMFALAVAAFAAAIFAAAVFANVALDLSEGGRLKAAYSDRLTHEAVMNRGSGGE